MLLRRLLSLLVLFSVALSSAESVLGELRDGEVHHESNIEALMHAASNGGGHHGHEGGGKHSHSHDGEHQHGTGADHCTHQHGAPLTTAFGFSLATAFTSMRVAEPPLHLSHSASGLFHPPRA